MRLEILRLLSAWNSSRNMERGKNLYVQNCVATTRSRVTPVDCYCLETQRLMYSVDTNWYFDKDWKRKREEKKPERNIVMALVVCVSRGMFFFQRDGPSWMAVPRGVVVTKTSLMRCGLSRGMVFQAEQSLVRHGLSRGVVFREEQNLMRCGLSRGAVSNGVWSFKRHGLSRGAVFHEVSFKRCGLSRGVVFQEEQSLMWCGLSRCMSFIRSSLSQGVVFQEAWSFKGCGLSRGAVFQAEQSLMRRGLSKDVVFQ